MCPLTKTSRIHVGIHSVVALVRKRTTATVQRGSRGEREERGGGEKEQRETRRYSNEKKREEKVTKQKRLKEREAVKKRNE